MTRITQTAVLLSFAAVLWGAVSGRAQDPAAGLQLESIDVQLVHVEAQVVDRDGNPVGDLRADEVRLLEDGNPVELLHFDRIGGTGPDSQDSRSAPATVVVFLDELHTGPERRDAVYREVAESLSSLLRDEDRVMLVRFDSEGVEVLVPFTADHRDVFSRMRNPGPATAAQIQAGFEDRRALETIRRAQEVEKGGSTGRAGSCLSIGGLAQNHAESVYHRVVQTIDALTAFVNSMAGIEGRKMLLHVSDGLPLVAGGQAFQYAMELCDGSGQREGIPLAEDVTTLGALQRDRWDPFTAASEAGRYDTSPEWQRLAAHANTHQVTFFPILAAGESVRSLTQSPEVRTTNRTATFGWRNRQDTLSLIAQLTGGEAMLYGPQIESGLARLVRDAHRYYLLSYEPRPGSSGEIRRIEVEVDRPGVSVRHRQSYRWKDADEKISDSLLSSLLYDEEANPLDLSVSVEREGAVGAVTPVRLRFSVPTNRLTLLPAGDAGRQGLMTVYLMARDGRGVTTPLRKQSMPLFLASERPAFEFEVEMRLPPVDHHVAIAVRDDLGRVTTLIRESVAATGL